MKRLLALAVVAALPLTACGSGDKSEISGKSRQVTLTFWNGYTGPDRPALEALVKKFNDTHPGVRIEMNIMTWDVLFQKLLPAFTSGNGPDLVAFDDAHIGRFAAKGVLAPLDDWYTEEQKASLVKPAVEATVFKGKHYAVPMTFTPILMYYNKKLFKDAGLDPAKPPVTWRDWQAALKKLTKDTNGDGRPEQYGTALPDHQTIQVWPILLWGNGGDLLSLGSPQSVQAVQQWSDLIVKDRISPTGLGGADADKLFQTGKAATNITGPWMTTGFKEAGLDFGVAMVPAGPAGPVTLAGASSFVVNAEAGEAKQKAAREWFTFWNSRQSQIEWSNGSGFPGVRTDVTPADTKANPYVAQFAAHSAKARVLLPGQAEFRKIYEEIFEPAIQRVTTGKTPAPQALDEAAKAITAVAGP
ncbi:ABC transporter substrate-binding protein [Nonomuraea typhae]|uniref:ABC transporter substrate-binding protein n=1 Tax=Nonomuraea typhae TaxID=2603600 RepID=UPI0012FA7909|nr:ABC transporter substrate-binding protein [Nonomuraea typhae]